ncbi:S9 family peptidase [Streptomyces sp. SYSU K217416]
MKLPDALTVEDLFGPPTRASASLSPDGTKIAYLAPGENRMNVWIESVDGAGDARCVTTENHGVQAYFWTDHPRWLLYTRDQEGDESWHLYRVDLENPDAAAVDLTPVPGARAALIDLPAGKPGKAVIQTNMRNFAEFDLVELDIATGDLTTLVRSPGGDVGVWLYSPSGEAYAHRTTANGDIELSRWDESTARLVPVRLFHGSDYPMGTYPMELTPDGTGVLLGSNEGTDRTRLVRVDLATGEESEVDSHPVHSLDTCSMAYPQLPYPLIHSRRTGEVIGVRYLGERQVIHAVDPHFADVLEHLEKLSDGDLAAVSSDESEQRWVISFTHDRDPDVTYFYDHSTGESRLLFRGRQNLDRDALAPMRPVTITSRDGLPLHSYLTLPVGIDHAGLPLVLFVHGGPWTRDIWHFNPVAQLFANRGYAVLQVNFRGSTGYGKAFTKAAIGQFAGRMHDDLIDGVNWAVDQGYADPDRVAILGGSYGGYAALVGAAFTPDVFAAAVDIVGISNLATFMRSQPDFVKPHLVNNWYRYVGDPADPRQEADLLARSPISRVDQIRTPLMVVQAANDARVNQAESDQIVQALHAHGVPVEYTVMMGGGHAFDDPKNAIALYQAVERFLGEHLRVEPRK